ncbi:hypothetical protein CK503_15040 [Aliifodinibius salipaludis]|uniref:DUF748 domain-containing protein n=1 Tax=Fodinibius salipaludis TaxID=2032627 RepID=A0A2A2G714_9BACT|nr:DUF748 domain-containing protein [Aliifodinibius salipaludis]PAU92804.1 hypothetical protein CK503_15040 [Aliifodinibius salipaludis]
MQRYQKVLIGVLVTVLILIGGIQVYLSFYLDKQLKKTTVERFHKATDGSYDLEIGDLDLQLLSRKISLSDITLTTKKESETNVRVVLEHFDISGIGLFKLLFWNELRLQEVDLINPEVHVTTSGTDTSAQDQEWSSPSRKASESVLKVLNQLSIPKFSITGLSLQYSRANLPFNPLLSIPNSDITLSNITIDSTSLKDHRIIPAENIEVAFQDLRLQSPNELYEISASQLEFSSSNSVMVVNELSVIPKLEKVAFSEKVGHEIDRIDLGIQQIKWEKIDINRANSAEGIAAGLINITNADLDIYHDKRPPEPAKSNKPLPQEIIRGIPFPIALDSIRIVDSNIRYSERQPKTEKEGYIEFSNLSATLTNLTNIETRWDDGKIPTLHAKTDVMEHAQLDVKFTFPIANGENRQEIKGTLQPMDMQPLNNALEPLAFVRIDEGRILDLEFDMNLSEKQAGGTLNLQYQDLKISLLDKEGSEENFGDKAKSLLANTFKIKSNNKGEDLRIAKVDFERIEHKSVFNYWWKSLLSGLKESIGL